MTNTGRINGNLNLSRSLGDLKYKVPRDAPPAEQLISAAAAPEPSTPRRPLLESSRAAPPEGLLMPL